MQFISHPVKDLNGEVFLDEEESFHAIKVLRHRRYDRIKIFDGKKRYFATIKDIQNGIVILTDLEEIKTIPKRYQINLFLPFIEKKDFELILRQATELGVDNFIPLITDYTQRCFVPCEVGFTRFNKIILSAVKQSERSSIPQILKPVRFNEVINSDKRFIVGSTTQDSSGRRIQDVLKDMDGVVNIMVGPEGGFSPYEKELISKSSFLFKIGDNILKTTTAAVALVGCVMYIIENESIF